MDCKKKRSNFSATIKEIIYLQRRIESEKNIISTLKAVILLKGGCDRYLEGFVIVIEDQRPKLEDVHVVFVEGLLGLPLDREIKFTIDLLYYPNFEGTL